MIFATRWSATTTSRKTSTSASVRSQDARRPAYLLGLCFCLAVGNANSAVEATKANELKDVKSRLHALARDLAKSEEKQSDAADQLRETETKISDATRRLRQLATERSVVQAELSQFDAQTRQLDQQAVRQQAQLGKALRAQSTQRDAGGLQSLLAARDPNQLARDDYFLTRLSQAKANIIHELQSIAAEQRVLAASANERKQQILSIETGERESRAELLTLQKKRQTTLATLAGKIQAQRRQIGGLKRDEQRLSKLIDGLGKLAAERPAKKSPVGAGDTPNRSAAAGANSIPLPSRERDRGRGGKGGSPVGAGNTPSKSKLINADPGKVAGIFGQLRGKLRAPVEGILKGRFGGAREEGGTTWKGIFIRADEGAEVRAVASGTVVFSEWMRGFGNLLVIDHDDDFFSVYGNNQTLLANSGQQVAAGAAVSTVGATGGIAEAGLYFELRHKGQPFDPLKWIAGKLK